MMRVDVVRGVPPPPPITALVVSMSQVDALVLYDTVAYWATHSTRGQDVHILQILRNLMYPHLAPYLVKD